MPCNPVEILNLKNCCTSRRMFATEYVMGHKYLKNTTVIALPLPNLSRVTMMDRERIDIFYMENVSVYETCYSFPVMHILRKLFARFLFGSPEFNVFA